MRETEWIGPKQLNIEGLGQNAPPKIKIAWFRPFDHKTPVTSVMIGETLDLLYVEDPDIPLPFDPDGDNIYYDGFDFSKSSIWGQTIPSNYTETMIGFKGIRMTEAGTHTASASAHDEWGAKATAIASVSVMAPNPIPIPQCPTEVTANHPVNMRLFDAKLSFSPKPYATIDHSRDEWTNRLTAYKNDSTEVILERVGLEVYDTDGLKSEGPNYCSIKVKPDTPPTAKLKVPPKTVRTDMAYIVNSSSSEDGDNIASAEYKYKYDARNNGFDDDSWVVIDHTDPSGFDFKPGKVGKYLFYTKVTDEYGITADTSNEVESTLVMDVVNIAPEVSFDIVGKNPQPNLDGINIFTVDEMLKWKLTETNSINVMLNPLSSYWTKENGTLASGAGANFGKPNLYIANNELMQVVSKYFSQYHQLYNAGLGHNGISPYRSIDAQSFDSAILTRIVDTKNAIIPAIVDIAVSGKYIYVQYDTGSKSDYMYRNFYIYDLTKMSTIRTEDKIVNWQTVKKYYYSGNNPIIYDLNSNLPMNVDGYNYTDVGYMVETDKYVYVSAEYRNWRPEYGTYIVMIDKATAKVVKSKLIPGYAERMYPDSKSGGIKMGSKLISADLETVSEAPYQSGIPNMIPPIGNYPLGYEPYQFSYFRSSPFTDKLGNSYHYEGYLSNASNGNMRGNLVMEGYVTKYDKNSNRLWLTRIDGAYFFDTGQAFNFSVRSAVPIMVMDDTNRKLYAPTFNENSYNPNIPVSHVLNMDTGAILSGEPDPIFRNAMNVSTVNFSGIENDYGTYTVDGTKATYSNFRTLTLRDATGYSASRDVGDVIDKDVGPYSGIISTNNDNPENMGVTIPVSDGILMNAIPQKIISQTASYEVFQYTFFVGKPSTTPLIINTQTNGQLMSNVDVSDAEFKFTVSMKDRDLDNRMFGLSFRMNGPTNRYALEADQNTIYVSKYVNGERTVLATSAYPFQSNQNYNFRIKTLGGAIEVYINNTPYLSVNDTTFKAGAFGYFADKGYMNYSSLSVKTIKEGEIEWLSNYAIWEPSGARAEVKYENLNYTDPENDPMAGSFIWSYKHTPKFLRNQGVSSLNGKVGESPTLTLDKVGVYEVTLKAKDDPHPDYRYPTNTFDSYRKESNSFINHITVHRRPVAEFTVSQAVSGTVNWNDISYDPDRWMSNSEYSVPDPTGINYQTTRGIVDRRYYYVSPSGKRVEAKLTAPQEKGTYEVGLSVQDEYGAWSVWKSVTIDIGKTIADTPPVPGFNVNPSTTYRNVEVTFTSTASDREDGKSDNLDHKYDIGNSIISTNRTTWSRKFTSIGSFSVRQVVTDSSNQSREVTKVVNVVNRPPKPTVTVPNGTASKPILYDYLNPTIKWTYEDVDQDPQLSYEVSIYRSDGTLTAHIQAQDLATRSWTPPNLPDHSNYYVQVAVHDGYEWARSNVTYFRIETNKPPVANFDYSPQPVYEGDTVSFHNLSTDPDGDILTFSWKVTGPKGYTYASKDRNPSVKWILPGAYEVTLTSSDGKGSDTITKTILVSELTIQGKVQHTPEWKRNLDTYNQSNPSQKRDDQTFWAGEGFLLEGIPTVTSTATKAVRIRVDAEPIGSLDLVKHNERSWTDTIGSNNASTELEKLKDGKYSFTFTVTYSNGVVKSTVVTIQILGNWDEYYRLHQRY